MATMPMRVEQDLFEAARSAGDANSRSAAQQINHWASIGRALEASGTLRLRDIERVLAGDGSYDALAERGLVRKATDPVVVLGRGELSIPLQVSAHRFSKTACLPSFYCYWEFH